MTRPREQARQEQEHPGREAQRRYEHNHRNDHEEQHDNSEAQPAHRAFKRGLFVGSMHRRC